MTRRSQDKLDSERRGILDLFRRMRLWFPLVLTGAVIVLWHCNGTTNPEDLDPVPIPNEPVSYNPHIQYLSEDSLVSFDPRLYVYRRGSDEQDRLLMDVEVEVRIENSSTDTLTVRPDRVSVYNYNSGGLVATRRLQPTGTTLNEHPIPSDSFVILNYLNDPIGGDIVYYPYENEFVAAFILIINGEEATFVTHVDNPQ